MELTNNERIRRNINAIKKTVWFMVEEKDYNNKLGKELVDSLCDKSLILLSDIPNHKSEDET